MKTVPPPDIHTVTLTFLLTSDGARCHNIDGDIEALTGFRAADLLANAPSFSSLIHPDDLDIRTALFELQTPVLPHSLTFRVIRKDGRVQIVRCAYEQLQQGTRGSRFQLHLQLPRHLPHEIVQRMAMSNLVGMLDNTDDFIYFKDRDHVFTGASQTLVTITDPAERWLDLIGKTDYDVFPRQYADVYFALEKKIFNGDMAVAQEIQPTLDKQGNPGWVDNRKYPIKDAHGTTIGLFGVARDITSIKLAQDALQKSEEQFRNLYENAPIGIFQSTLEGRFVHANPCMANMLGYDNAQALIDDISDIGVQLFADSALRAAIVEKVHAGSGWVYLNEVRWRRKDGSVVIFDASGRALTPAPGEPMVLEGIFQDVTERVHAEDKLKRLANLYAALSRCNEAIVRCKDRTELFNSICRDAVELAGMSMVWVSQVNSATGVVAPVASFGKGSAYVEDIDISVNEELATGRGPVGTSIRENRPVWCQDFEGDPMMVPWRERGRMYGWKSLASLPLVEHGVVVGAIAFYSEFKDAFEDAERNLFAEMAMDISFALDRFVDEAQQQAVRTELMEAQAINRIANKLAKMGGWKIEVPEMKLIWSDEVNEIHDLPLGIQPTVEQAISFYDPESLPIIQKAVNACIREGVSYDHELQLTTASGRHIWVRALGSAMRNAQGVITSVHGTFQDISDVKQTADSLRRLTQAVEQSPSSIVITDLNVNIVYANATFARQTGYSVSEVIGKNPRLLQSGKTSQTSYETLWDHLGRNEGWTGEFVNRRKDGSEYIESVRISPVRDDHGVVTNYLAIKDDITDQKMAATRIAYLAHYDQLTGLPNRTLLQERARYALGMAQRSGENLVVMFLDLDHFKNVNDTLGHSVGDQLIQEIAKRLQSTMREVDTVSRSGGDEFIFILPDTNALGASHVAASLMKRIAMPYQIGGNELITSSSIGIAVYPDDGGDMETLYKNADAAMYEAKQAGRNGFRFFTQEMQANSARNLLISNALRRALELNQLYLHYQPQVSIDDGHVVGAEALLRWDHPELGSVSPAEFIPIAESSGQIIEIGEWVLRTAVAQMKAWLDQGLPSMVVAVNLSAIQFKDTNLTGLVTSVLAEAGLAPEHLELELTEAVAMNDPLAAISVMNNLHDFGIRMSIDDFGTGYSSLSYLKRFKVYKLKIDQSFVQHIADNPEDKAIVTAVINMAASLGMHTIAEGVETAAQLAFLRLHGCDEVQGYFFSKPLSVAQFEAFVKKFAF